MLTDFRLLFAMSIAIIVGALGAYSDVETMSGIELRELYSKDVTECGALFRETEFTEYCELWQVGGSIKGRGDTENRGFYRIMVTKSEVCVTFGDNPESCGPYENLGQNKFRIMFANGSSGVVTIVPGDVNNLN